MTMNMGEMRMTLLSRAGSWRAGAGVNEELDSSNSII